MGKCIDYLSIISVERIVGCRYTDRGGLDGVLAQANSGEGYITVEGNAGDRNDLKAWHNGDALVARVAGANANTIVVVNSVGPIEVEAWINHPNAVFQVKKQVSCGRINVSPYLNLFFLGNALADVLGRLPYTIGKSINDYSAKVIYNSNASILPIPYSEGLFIDYRHFDEANIAPRFEFGFGLSYTTFAYASLSISGSIGTGTAPTRPGSSLDPWLHEKVITVTFSLTNSGSVAGHEVRKTRLHDYIFSSVTTDPSAIHYSSSIGPVSSAELERIRQCLPGAQPKQNRNDTIVEIRPFDLERCFSTMADSFRLDWSLSRRK
ncbi:glycoside hydrolase family protein [Salix suchowensis]|nr:glycoside hydrolase family protein [Salix suchowensis]